MNAEGDQTGWAGFPAEGGVLSGDSSWEDAWRWLDALVEKAWIESPGAVVDFMRATLSASDPPAMGSFHDRPTSRLVLNGLLLNAEDDAAPPRGTAKGAGPPFGEHVEALHELLRAGVVGRSDMTAGEAVAFLHGNRLAEGRCPAAMAESGRCNPAVVAMLLCGMPAGGESPGGVLASPAAASELLVACGEAAADSGSRCEALLLVARMAGERGGALDLDALLSPGHSGGELLSQARRLRDQLDGEPHFPRT